MNATLKNNSPFGSLIIEDMAAHGQKLGETVLNWRLQVDGQVSVAPTPGAGAHRLMVELNFTFDCYIEGQLLRRDQMWQVSQSQAQAPACGGGYQQGYGFHPGSHVATHGWHAPGYNAPWGASGTPSEPCMRRSGSQGHIW